MTTNKRYNNIPVKKKQFENDQPKPKTSYLIFDREQPETSKNLTHKTIPNICYQIYIFKKQTNYETKIQLITTNNDKFDQKIETTKSILKNLIGEQESTDMVSKVTKLSNTLT